MTHTPTQTRHDPVMHHLGDTVALAACLAAAQERGLLSALLDHPATATAHAGALGLDPLATERVLAVLVANGIADRDTDRYAATDAFRAFAARSPRGLGRFFALWGQVPAFLRTGERLDTMDGTAGERETAYRDVVAGLARRWAAVAEQLAAALGGHPRTILDVGAGSGVWSLAMAERHPDTHVTALDLPEVLAAFRSRAQGLGLAARIDTIAGDFHTAPIPPEQFDRVVVANVLHLESAERAAALLRHLSPGVRPGGELVIVDSLGGDPEAERARATYSLHLALRTAGGYPHARADLERWLREAGLEPEGVIPLDDPQESALVGRRRS